MEKVYTVNEVAAMFRVHQRTVRNWVNEGSLRAYKLANKTIRIPESAIKEFEQSK